LQSKQLVSEIGIGFYTKVYKAFTVESYLLASSGRSANSNPTYCNGNGRAQAGTINSSFTKIGLQFNLGLKLKKGMIGAGIRAAQLDYHNINGSIRYGGVDQLEYLNQFNKINLIEPAFTYAIGGEILQFAT
jgi:hypothetical protein